jgi:hypothetical protein
MARFLDEIAALDRRTFLGRCGMVLGAAALRQLLARDTSAAPLAGNLRFNLL